MGAGASADKEDHEERLLAVLGGGSNFDSPVPNTNPDFKSPTTNLFDTAAKQTAERKGKGLLSAKQAANKLHKNHSHKKILVSPASSSAGDKISPSFDQRIEGSVFATPQSMGGSLRQSPRTILAGKFGLALSPKPARSQTSVAGAMAISAFASPRKTMDASQPRRTTFRALANLARMSVKGNNNKKEDESKLTIVEFDYDYDFDDNGILYYLGTQGYLLEWMNPTKVPLPIRCQRSSDGKPKSLSGTAEDVCNHNHIRSSWTEDKPHQWWQLDMGPGRACRPSQYTLRHGTKLDNPIRTWRFLASNDPRHWNNQRIPKTGEKGQGTKGDWVHLHLTFGDRSLDGSYSTATWDVLKLFNGKEHDFYRYFRIEHMGLNADEGHMLSLSGVEMYGELRLDMQAQASHAHRYKAATMITNMCRVQMGKSIFAVMRAKARERYRKQKVREDACRKIQTFHRTIQNRTRFRFMNMAKMMNQLKQRSAIVITSFVRRYIAVTKAIGIVKEKWRRLMAVRVIQRNSRILLARVAMSSMKDVIRAHRAAKQARIEARIKRNKDMHTKRDVETKLYIVHHHAVIVIQRWWVGRKLKVVGRKESSKRRKAAAKDLERAEEQEEYLQSDEFRMLRLGKLQILLDEKLQQQLDERYEQYEQYGKVGEDIYMDQDQEEGDSEWDMDMDMGM